METQTRFDLNQQVTRWRNSLLAREAMDAEGVRELDSHLREAMVELHAKGLSEEEAFLLATRRLGDANALAAQFERDDPISAWKRRVFWMLAGVLLARESGNLLGMVTKLAHLGSWPSWITLMMYSACTLGIPIILLSGRFARLAQFLEMFCSRKGRFAWRFAAVTLIFPVLQICTVLPPQLRQIGHNPNATASIWLYHISICLATFIPAVLAGFCAPLRNEKNQEVAKS